MVPKLIPDLQRINNHFLSVYKNNLIGKKEQGNKHGGHKADQSLLNNSQFYSSFLFLRALSTKGITGQSIPPLSSSGKSSMNFLLRRKSSFCVRHLLVLIPSSVVEFSAFQTFCLPGSVSDRKWPHPHLGHEKPEAGDPAHQWRGALLASSAHLLQPAGPSQVHELGDAASQTPPSDRPQSRL